MADSPHKSVRDEIWDNLRAYERHLSANERHSNAAIRRDSRDLIKRLEQIITVQEERVKKMRRQSIGRPSQTHRLRASMQDVLATYRLTLQHIRQSADTLELAWAMLES